MGPQTFLQVLSACRGTALSPKEDAQLTRSQDRSDRTSSGKRAGKGSGLTAAQRARAARQEHAAAFSTEAEKTRWKAAALSPGKAPSPGLRLYLLFVGDEVECLVDQRVEIFHLQNSDQTLGEGESSSQKSYSG